MFFDIYSWGLQIIKAMQSVSTPALNEFVKIFTNIGSTYFYLAILCALYWCVDQKRGFKFTYIMLLSTGVNLIIKNALKVLRPYQIDKSVKIIEENEYSTPSGHAQSSACFWQLFMFDFTRQFGKKWKNAAWFLAIFMPLLIGLSRIYLGVHFPSDVFLGWAVGAIFAIIGFWCVPKLSEFIKKLPQSPKIL